MPHSGTAREPSGDQLDTRDDRGGIMSELDRQDDRGGIISELDRQDDRGGIIRVATRDRSPYLGTISRQYCEMDRLLFGLISIDR